MTGRELIIYILQNNLEDAELFSSTDSLLPFFIPVEELAVEWGSGKATLKALIEIGKLKGIRIGDRYFVLATEKNPFEKREVN